MKKTLIYHLLTTLYLFCNTSLIGQDTLIKSNNDVFIARVVFNDWTNGVTYFQYLNADTLIYSIAQSKLKSIHYFNGTKNAFITDSLPLLAPSKLLAAKYKSNIISVDLLSPAYSLFSACYERRFKKEKIGISLVFSKNINGVYKNEEYERSSSRTCLGIDFNLYFDLIRKNCYPKTLKLLIAPSYEYGSFIYSYTNLVFSHKEIVAWDKDTIDYYIRTSEKPSIGYRHSVVGKFGIVYKPNKHIEISFITSIGAIIFNKNYTQFKSTGKLELTRSYFKGEKEITPEHPKSYINRVTGFAGINIGFRF